jgi:hypothetical protein
MAVTALLLRFAAQSKCFRFCHGGIHLAQDFGWDRHHAVFRLNDCRAPGLEQKHSVAADYRPRVRNGDGIRGRMGRADAV